MCVAGSTSSTSSNNKAKAKSPLRAARENHRLTDYQRQNTEKKSVSKLKSKIAVHSHMAVVIEGSLLCTL